MTLPSTWQRTNLGEVIDGIDAGKNVRCEERPPAPSERGIIKISAVTWGVFDPTQAKTAPDEMVLPTSTLIRKGDLLISRANTLELVGAPVIVEETPANLYLSDKVLRIRTDPDIARWLNLYLRSADGRLEIEMRATGNQLSMRNIGQEALRAIRIPLPPLPEQRRIVARIEALFARTRRARADLERIAPLTERYRHRQVDTELEAGRDEGWPALALADVASETRNGIATKPSDEPPGTPILRISAVRPGRVTLADRRYHRPATPGDDRAYHLHERDLLFIRFNGNAALVAACGMVRHLAEPCVYPDKLIRMRLDEAKALPEYVEMASASGIAREQLADHIKTAAGQHGISGSDLKTLRLPMPDVAIQRIIAARVTSHRLAVEAAEHEATRALALLDRMEQSILTRAFRGELVPQDPREEPAAALLARLRGTTPVSTRRSRPRAGVAA